MNARTPGSFYVRCGNEAFPCTASSRADARLIAAAPDLLEALEMVRDADDDQIRDGFPGRMPPLLRAAIDAAVAKARGAK